MLFGKSCKHLSPPITQKYVREQLNIYLTIYLISAARSTCPPKPHRFINGRDSRPTLAYGQGKRRIIGNRFSEGFPKTGSECKLQTLSLLKVEIRRDGLRGRLDARSI